MNGHGYSPGALTRYDVNEDTVKEMETVLKTFSNAGADVSDEVLEQIRRFLETISQAWAQSRAPDKLLDIGIVRTLATIFDNLIQTDHGRSEVLTSILELLFIVEDMSDSDEGKIVCGKLFLLRLMAFVTASIKTPSLKLQRAVIETICALVTRSPENQQAVLDQKVECYKLFKVILPRCGDFQLQASITEIFYRLAKRGPHLLHFIPDKEVKKSMESLIKSKKPDLLMEIRKIVTHLNESLGPLRSVYSFLAERISINGHEIVTDDKWVNIGQAQLSFYCSRLPDSPDDDENSIVDVPYEDILEVKRSSPTILEILVRKGAGFSSCKPTAGRDGGSSTILRTEMHFKPADLSTFESSILPKVCALSVGRGLEEGKKASNSHFVDKAASNGSKGGLVNLKTLYHTNMSGNLGKRVSLSPILAGDVRLLDRVERHERNEKSGLDQCLDNLHSAPDFVSESPQDVDTLEEAVIAKSSKTPGRHTQPRLAKGSSAIMLFNTLHTAEEDRLLQDSNMEPVHAYHNMSSEPLTNIQAPTNHSLQVEIVPTGGGNVCTNERPSRKPCHLMTQNLQALSGPKTESPSDANVRARVSDPNSETKLGTDTSRRKGELRMKKRHDPHPTNDVVSIDSPRHAGKINSVTNTLRHLKDPNAHPGVRGSSESSGKHPMAPLICMPASDSVMTDIREKPVTSKKGAKSCPTKSSKDVRSCARRHSEKAVNNSSRTLRKRKCKTAVRYFDAYDDASDSSTEFAAKRQKKDRDKVTIPPICKNAYRGTQAITKRAHRAAAQQESRALTVCPRNDRSLDKHLSGRKTLAKSSGEQNRSAGMLNSRNDDVEDVFRFTPNPIEEPEAQKTSLALTWQGRQNSEVAEPDKEKRKQSAKASRNLLSAARRRSCTSDGPHGEVIKSPSRTSPALQKRDEVTPDQHGPENPAGTSTFSRSSDTDKRVLPSALQTRKTYSKSGKIVTRNSRLERWRSSSIRKLELPEMDAASEDESIDGVTPASSPLANVLEETAEEDGESSSDIGVIAKWLKRFKHKVKLVEKRNVEDILTDTTQRIQCEIRSAEERIRGQKAEFTDTCNNKCGQLDNQLQEQIKKMRALHDKFQQEFAQHLESYRGIGREIEETGLELNDLAKQQGHDHEDVVARLKESCKDYLADADQKIIQAGKESSTGIRSLKEALQGTLKYL